MNNMIMFAKTCLRKIKLNRTLFTKNILFVLNFEISKLVFSIVKCIIAIY